MTIVFKGCLLIPYFVGMYEKIHCNVNNAINAVEITKQRVAKKPSTIRVRVLLNYPANRESQFTVHRKMRNFGFYN